MAEVEQANVQERLSRLLVMLPWLAANPDVGVEEVAKRFDISEKQVVADVVLLTLTGPNQFGGGLVDIAYEGKVITVRDAKGLDQPVVVPEESVYPLILGLEILAANTDGQNGKRVAQVLGKLRDALGLSQALIVNTLPAASESDRAKQQLIAQAIEDKFSLRFDYENSNGSVKARWVTPQQISDEDSRLFLSAWDHEQSAPRLYRLDRISNIELAESPAEISNDVAEDDINLSTRTFRLALHPSAIYALEDYPTGRIVSRSPDLIEVEFPLYQDGWAVETALSLAPWLQSVSPTSLHDLVISHLQQVVRSHQT